MANTTFSGPVISTNGFEGAVQVPTYTVATAPSAAGIAGTVIYVTDGVAGQPGLAFSNGTDWKRADTPATTIAAV